MKKANHVLVVAGFGAFTLMKRDDGRWVAQKRIGDQVRQVSIGKTNTITDEKLDDAAIRLYAKSADI